MISRISITKQLINDLLHESSPRSVAPARLAGIYQRIIDIVDDDAEDRRTILEQTQQAGADAQAAAQAASLSEQQAQSYATAADIAGQQAADSAQAAAASAQAAADAAAGIDSSGTAAATTSPITFGHFVSGVELEATASDKSASDSGCAVVLDTESNKFILEVKQPDSTLKYFGLWADELCFGPESNLSQGVTPFKNRAYVCLTDGLIYRYSSNSFSVINNQRLEDLESEVADMGIMPFDGFAPAGTNPAVISGIRFVKATGDHPGYFRFFGDGKPPYPMEKYNVIEYAGDRVTIVSQEARLDRIFRCGNMLYQYNQETGVLISLVDDAYLLEMLETAKEETTEAIVPAFEAISESIQNVNNAVSSLSGDVDKTGIVAFDGIYSGKSVNSGVYFVEGNEDTPGYFVEAPMPGGSYASDKFNVITVEQTGTTVEARKDRLFRLRNSLYSYSSSTGKLSLMPNKDATCQMIIDRTTVKQIQNLYMGYPVFYELDGSLYGVSDDLEEYDVNNDPLSEIFYTIDELNLPDHLFLNFSLRAAIAPGLEGSYTNYNFPVIMPQKTLCFVYDPNTECYHSDKLVLQHPKTRKEFEIQFNIYVDITDLKNPYHFEIQARSHPSGVRIFHGFYEDWFDFVEKNKNFLVAPGDVIQYCDNANGWICKAFVHPPYGSNNVPVGPMRLEDAAGCGEWAFHTIWSYFT